MYLLIITLLLSLLLPTITLAKSCTNLTIPLTIHPRLATFSLPDLTTNALITSWTNNLTSTAHANYTDSVLTGYDTVTLTANISATFCRPDTGIPQHPVVQILTHGIGFDKSYWDLPFNNYAYSYTASAVDEFNYCTLSYDRLGIAASYAPHLSPYAAVQASAQIAVLAALNTLLRTGTLPSVPHAFNASSSIVNVGHSFGAQQVHALSAQHPDLSDAIILTGFSFDGRAFKSTLSSFGMQMARLNQPFRFGNATASPVLRDAIDLALRSLTHAEAVDLMASSLLSNLLTTSENGCAGQDLPEGYLTWSSVAANQYNFLHAPTTDPAILGWLERNKQPFTVAEILTLGGRPEVSLFKGPVMILTGREDAIYCSGDCEAVGGKGNGTVLDQAGVFFPHATSFEGRVVPGMGHAVNAHYTARQAYEEMGRWLGRNGVVSS